MEPVTTQPNSGMAANPTAVPSWGRTALLLLLVVAGILAALHETAWSIVAIWLRSDTYAHGFLIAPISLWLVWDKRKALAGMYPRPALLPLLLMLPVGFLWLSAYLVDVLVVQQYALVGLLILGMWSVLGTPVTRFLAFPIGFLLLSVPIGEGLIYPMMNFTADFTVGMLRLTGIAVYRDGIFFSIPTGDWSVVEACSGVRYLIASVTLGILYAYLTYTKLWKQLIFVGVSIVVPIFANGLRAYMIVMIAHLSDMKLAVGIDHLIYGWVFFGIIVTILFLIGSIWRDPPSEGPRVSEVPPSSRGSGSAAATAASAVVIAVFWSGIAWALERAEGDVGAVRLSSPLPEEGWRGEPGSLWDWRPNVVGPDGEYYGFFVNQEGTPVGLYLGVYRTQRQGAELLGSQNQMVAQKHPVWSDKEQTLREIRLQGQAIRVNQSRLASRTGEHLLVWSWYRIGEHHTANQYLGKAIEALSRLFGLRRDGTLVAIAAPYTERPAAAAEVLQAFVDAMLDPIDRELDRAVAAPP